MKRKFQEILYKIVILLHTIIVVIGFLGLFLIFYKPFQLFFSIFYLVVIGSEIIFLGKCPLTKLEDKLKKNLKYKKDNETFINRILLKYFNFSISNKLIKMVLIGYFILSIFFIEKFGIIISKLIY